MNGYLVSLVLVSTIGCSTLEPSDPYPSTPRSEVAEEIAGRVLRNPYAWLEDLSSPEVWDWAEAQSSLTRTHLSRSGSAAARLVARLESLSAGTRTNTPLRRGGRFFFLSEGVDGGKPALYESEDGSRGRDRLVARPEDVAEAGIGDSQIVDFRVSPSGGLVVVVIEETRTGRRMARVLESGADPRSKSVIEGPWLGQEPWNADESAIYFSGRESGRGVGVWSYQLATERIEPVELPDIDPEEARVEVSVSQSLDGLVVLERRASAGSRAFFVPMRSENPEVAAAMLTSTSRLRYLGSVGLVAYFLDVEEDRVVGSRWDGGRFVEFLALDVSGRSASAVQLLGGRFVLTTSREGELRVEILDLDGTRLAALRPPLGLLWTNFPPGWPAIVGGAAERFAYTNSLSLDRPGIYEIDTEGLELRPWRLRDVATPEGRRAIVVDRQRYPSWDGEHVPVSVVRRRDTGLDDGAPVLVWVYGAHGFVATPFFNAFFRTFIEAGGILVMPQVRGGGAHGRRWHEAGSRANKRNTVLDAVASIEWLEAIGLARPGSVAVMGNSAGSVPAFAAALARTDLVAALILEVPLGDLVRHAEWSGGWATEFGVPDHPTELATLLEVSPYEALAGRRRLPATLVLAGERDAIAPPHHAFKLVAAMQHAQTDSAPILLHLVEGAGHQIGVDARQRLDSQALELTFLSAVLGLE